MLVIAHRAQDAKEPIHSRFGVEIDVCPNQSTPIVCHDPINANAAHSPTLSWWIYEDLNTNGPRPVYAVNVKADGFEEALIREFLLRPALLEHSFFFDGSYPTMRRLKTLNVPVAERISEEEPYRGHSDIIWLDRWDWLDGEGAIPMGRPVACGEDKCVRMPLLNNKTGNRTIIYAVSPELHLPNCPPGYRQYWWRRFAEMGVTGICTDYWLECEGFFGGNR